MNEQGYRTGVEGMTKVDQLAGKLDRTSAKSHHVNALVEGLQGHPEDYVYTGECFDTGGKGKYEHCACGTEIRYVFIVENPKTGHKAYIGNVCIGHFSTVNAEQGKVLQEASDKLMEQLKEAAKITKDISEGEEVEKLKVDYQKQYYLLVDAFESYRSRGVKAPYDLWQAVEGYRGRFFNQCYKKYQRSSSYIKWYEKHTAEIKNLLERFDITDEKVAADVQEQYAATRSTIQGNMRILDILTKHQLEKVEKYGANTMFVSDFVTDMVELLIEKPFSELSEGRRRVIAEICAKEVAGTTRKNSKAFLEASKQFYRELYPEVDLCDRCGSPEIYIDDFGVIRCQPCWDADPETRNYVNDRAAKEKIDFGYE
jgi:hypothetical protein